MLRQRISSAKGYWRRNWMLRALVRIVAVYIVFPALLRNHYLVRKYVRMQFYPSPPLRVGNKLRR